jgi:hypothetical protein
MPVTASTAGVGAAARISAPLGHLEQQRRRVLRQPRLCELVLDAHEVASHERLVQARLHGLVNVEAAHQGRIQRGVPHAYAVVLESDRVEGVA